ncbi:MAG: hypothetical protein ACTSUN_03330 [Promethearchaeota archaeon]
MKGTGWEPFLTFGDPLLQDRMLFGSTWLSMGQTIKQLADGIMELPLKESTMRNGFMIMEPNYLELNKKTGNNYD